MWAFGVFQLDALSLELTRSGRPVPLAPLPAQALALLVERAGQVVDRESLVDRLWGTETYVDAAAGIHTAIRQIRRALGDSATHSRFVETLPRRGYRFTAPVERRRVIDGAPLTSSAGRPQRAVRVTAGLVAALAIALLSSRLWRREEVPAPPRPPAAASHPAVLDAYFKGRYVLETPGVESAGRAIGFFERALRLDSGHALSWLGLAQARLRLAFAGAGPAGFHEARAAADQALGLDPTLGEAWAVRAQARWLAEWDWTGAEADYRQALDRAPDDGAIHLAYAFFCAASGQHDAAIRHGLQSRRLSPLDPNANLDLAWLYLYARRWDQVLAESLNALALEPNLFTAHYTLAMAYEHLGEEGHAEEAYLAMWRAAGAARGHVEAARALPAAERDATIRDWWTAGEGAARLPAYERALIHLSRGEGPEAWGALAESVDRRELQSAMLAVDPRLDALRCEPEFSSLLAATGRAGER